MPPKSTSSSLDEVILTAETALLVRNPKKDKPWFDLSKNTLAPICNAHSHTHLQYHNKPSDTNRLHYREMEKVMNKAVIDAKELWAKQPALNTMKYTHDPIKSWKDMQIIKKGLTHHHTQCQTI
eukprot:8775756-Ditylum_brightwellii.AAC.1